MNPKPVPYGESTGPSSHGWHKIESALRCPKEYQFEQVRRVTTPKAQMPDYFSVGILMHVAKGHWFASQFDTSEKMMKHCADKVNESALRQPLPVSGKAINDTMRYFAEYVEHYRIRPLPRVIAAEYPIGPARLVKTDKTGWSKRTARLDDVSVYPEAQNRLCIGESKTTSSSIQDAVLQYTMHGQPYLQMALWDLSKKGKGTHGEVAGVMLDVIVKGYGNSKSKFGRVLIPRPPVETMTWFKQNLSSALESMQHVEWDSDVPRNITMCTRMVGRARVQCPYFRLCQYGKPASGQFVLEGGHSLLDKTKWGGVVPPWA
jgi:hypothetical protein